MTGDMGSGSARGTEFRDVGGGFLVDQAELDRMRGFTGPEPEQERLEQAEPSRGTAQSPERTRNKKDGTRREGGESLLRRQRDDAILMLIRLGVTEREIANELGLRQSTVNKARHRALLRRMQ